MAESRYEPPRQSGAGQLIDSVLLLVLVYLALLAPLLLSPKPAQAPVAEKPAAQATWQGLGQTPVQAQQWEKLGLDPEHAKPMIEHRFDYSIDIGALLLTIGVIVGYFVFVLRVSEKEYREVIREHFDGSGSQTD